MLTALLITGRLQELAQKNQVTTQLNHVWLPPHLKYAGGIFVGMFV